MKQTPKLRAESIAARLRKDNLRFVLWVDDSRAGQLVTSCDAASKALLAALLADDAVKELRETLKCRPPRT